MEICTNTTHEIDVKNSSTATMDFQDDVITDSNITQASYEIHTTTPQIYSNDLSPPLPIKKYSPKSEGSLHYSHTTSNVHTHMPYSYDHPQRSASCRDLYDLVTDASPLPKPKVLKKKSSYEERKLESPITRYDDSHRSLYNVMNRNTSLDIQQDIIVLDHKIYSSSYPGTVTLSQDSVEDPGNYELAESQDDLSHDSYELLERSDDDLSGGYRFRGSYPIDSEKTRSGSLDSGNYLQSVSDTDSEEIHQFKSSQDIFLMDDPRDLPREINPPKSDGSFYRMVKLSSRTSSVESKSDYYDSMSSSKKLSKVSSGSRTSSVESKSDKETKTSPKIVGETLKAKSSSIIFPESFPSFKELTPTPHVHSVSLQNVETERNLRNNRTHEPELNTIPRATKSSSKSTYIWPESISGLPTEIESKSAPATQSKSVQLESSGNIFSFDDDKIKELKESDYAEGIVEYPYPPLPVMLGDLPEILDAKNEEVTDELMAHPPIERTKSDPNTVTNRQRLSSSSRRQTLIHQKSIDAESSDDDYLYRQIPSAPPLSKSFITHFEMPTAEFGHFDILQRDVETSKTKFEVPMSQFEILGAKTQFDLINLPPKDNFDIPYILHKRHVMNGTAPKIEEDLVPTRKLSAEMSPQIEIQEPVPVESPFLFTQNIDLSHINPVTLEVDKNDLPVLSSSPKRDITKIDPLVLETLNMKLSRIESDSPPHSHPIPPKIDVKNVLKAKYNSDMAIKARAEAKPKRIIKGKNKKGKNNKGKVRITSFSSDDESINSDDVFGTNEDAPTKSELSPPQHRKEMESILKYESERQTHLQYTMSSTEVEGSPPQPRKSDMMDYDRSLEVRNTELRRISERSLSIPSSEEDLKPTLEVVPETKPNSEMPPTTLKSTELIGTQLKLDSIMRRGNIPGLFAHARLNLSEGTGFSLMQRQTTLQSPTSSRRAKSLDTAVVSYTSLPPPTAFSSKDDTLEIPIEFPIIEPPPEPLPPISPPSILLNPTKPTLKIDVTTKPPLSPKSNSSTPTSTKSFKKTSSKDKLSPKLKVAPMRVADQRQSQKSKSFEKVEAKKVSSKERSKSQDDNELNIRRKKQQMLYETAIKQTKTIKSPVKETLPPFPIVEDSVSVSDGKLEIKIDVTNSTIPDDAIIITKSPKRLDKKLTKSLELNFPDDPFGTEKQVGRLGQSLDLAPLKDLDSDSKPGFSTEAGDTSEETSDIESETNDPPNESDLEEVEIMIPDIKEPEPSDTDIPYKKIDSDISSKLSLKEESLTDVSDLKGELLKKMSAERSKSEDTASWITVECEEYIGLEDEDKDISLNEEDNKLLNTINRIKFGDTRSRSSDTTGSWTSGEKDLSPIQQQSNESSVSCSIIRPFGISQVIEKYDTREQLENELLTSSEKGPRSPLKRSSPVDEESSSSGSKHEDKLPRKTLQSIKTSSKSSTDTSSLTASSFEHDKILRGKYPFEQKWLSENELIKGKIKSHRGVSGVASADDSGSDRKNGSDTPRIRSIEKLSMESISKTESTESSSGSLGVAYRQQKTGEAPIAEPSSTWRPFLIDSSGSSSLEDGLLPPDQDIEDKEYYLTKDTYSRFKSDDEESETVVEAIDSTTGFVIPATSSDIIPNYGAAYLSRTLSRISERSSNSEKSSLEEGSKDSTNEESVISSDQQASLSSDPSSAGKPPIEIIKKKSSSSTEPSPPDKFKPTHLLGSHLTRQISDDRRTSAEMADLSLDEVELILTEDKLRRQNSDDTIIEEHSDEECLTPQLKCSSSQESEDWPLPEIPPIPSTSRRLSSVPSMETDSPPQHYPDERYYNLPKIFGLRGSIQSEDSGQWPSPPGSQIQSFEVETTFYIEAEQACKVVVSDSISEPTPDIDNEVFEQTIAEDLISKSPSSSEVSVEIKPKRIPEGRKLLSKQTSVMKLTPESSESDNSENISKSGGASFSESNMTTVLMQNISASYSGTSKSLKGPNAKDDDSLLSLSEWSSSNSHPLGPNSPLSKSENGLHTKEKIFTKSTERPIKIPSTITSPTSPRVSLQSTKFLQKSISYDQNQDFRSGHPSNFKTVPLIRHRNNATKKSSTIPSELASTSSSNVSVSDTSDYAPRVRKDPLTQNRKFKLLRQKSNDALRDSDSESDI